MEVKIPCVGDWTAECLAAAVAVHDHECPESSLCSATPTSMTRYAGLARAAVDAVTPADVQRVARRYFDEDQSVTGWFVPLPAPEKGT